MRLLIMGPQGSGKGTQAAMLAKDLGVPHVSTGELFRECRSSGSRLGESVGTHLDAGTLIPDGLLYPVVTERLDRSDTGAGFLLDGFPRTAAQAVWLEAFLSDRGSVIDAVILLEAPESVLVERMRQRGRQDDTPEAITRRLAIYRSDTAPLIEIYRDRIVRVDATGEVERVQDAMRSAVMPSSIQEGQH